MAAEPFWQEFAAAQRLAIVACRFTDKPHDQGFIEEYVNVSQGSGQALLDALAVFAKQSGHAEVAGAPLVLWGMSAGGQFNYEFAAWKPERVIAFVVNKGGIYYSALVPRAARHVPALLFVGDKDLAFRTDTIVGLFAVNRRAGALWALVNEPETAHAVGRSRDLGAMFFADVLAQRLSSGTMTPANTRSGSSATSRPAHSSPRRARPHPRRRRPGCRPNVSHARGRRSSRASRLDRDNSRVAPYAHAMPTMPLGRLRIAILPVLLVVCVAVGLARSQVRSLPEATGTWKAWKPFSAIIERAHVARRHAV